MPFAELQKQGLTYWKLEMFRKQEKQAPLVSNQAEAKQTYRQMET